MGEWGVMEGLVCCGGGCNYVVGILRKDGVCWGECVIVWGCGF